MPGGLRHDRKSGVFPPRLRDMAAESGDFTGITRRSGRVLAGNGAQNAKKCARLFGTGRRGLSPTEVGGGKHPFTARFTPPRGPGTRQRAVNRTGLRPKCRFSQPRDFGQTRPQARYARRVTPRPQNPRFSGGLGMNRSGKSRILAVSGAKCGVLPQTTA
jgi:hypothetical protein